MPPLRTTASEDALTNALGRGVWEGFLLCLLLLPGLKAELISATCLRGGKQSLSRVDC